MLQRAVGTDCGMLQRAVGTDCGMLQRAVGRDCEMWRSQSFGLDANKGTLRTLVN